MSHIIILAFALVFAQTPTEAQTEGLGLGITVGEPTGLTGKLWVSEHTAFAGAVAWSFRNSGSLQIQGDYLIHLELTGEIKRDIKGRSFFHYGIGGRIRDDPADNRMSVRVPLGITYAFAKSPLDFFVEAVPMLDLAPETDFDVGGAIGARFFFGAASRASGVSRMP